MGSSEICDIYTMSFALNFPFSVQQEWQILLLFLVNTVLQLFAVSMHIEKIEIYFL